jgi:hypothetical protein
MSEPFKYGKLNMFGWIDDLARWLLGSLFGRRTGVVRRIIAWALVLFIAFAAVKTGK